MSPEFPRAVRPIFAVRALPATRAHRRALAFLAAGALVATLSCASGERRADAGDDGLRPIFNGRDLTGWKGLVGDPVKRAKMSREELAREQGRADERMREHWSVVDGVLTFDGKGENLCTAAEYENFEMVVDWTIEPKGDSGIYLRGTPQVQIWDNPEGSGGLWNNKQHPSKPLVVADHPIGQWNTFRIRMVGENVSVWLNGTLVVDDVVLENYWERDKPIYPSGAVELQSHGNPLRFRNIRLREIPKS